MKNMTESEKARAIITASYILYLVDALMDKSDRTNMTTIRLIQALRSKTSQAQNKEYVELSNKAWARVVDKYKDKNMRMAIFDAVEFLYFNEEQAMNKMFGSNIADIISRFVIRHTYGGVEKDVLLESREVCKALTDETKKEVFEWLKKS